MDGQKLLWTVLLLVVTVGLLFAGCDKLVTENNTITVIDTTLGKECLSCHKDTDNSFLRPKGQYANSAHFASWQLIDAPVTIDGSPFNVSHCGENCHTHEGFLRELGTITSSDSAYSVIGCFTCHLPHTGNVNTWNADTLRGLLPTVELNNGEFIKMGKSDNCLHCHQAASAPDITQSTVITAGWGPHYSPQADMITGSGGHFIEFDRGANVHQGDTITGGCIVCHYGVGSAPGQGYEFAEHTFRLQDTLGGDTTYFTDNCGKTSTCHNGSTAETIVDFYNFETIDSIRSKADHLESILKTAGILNAFDQQGKELVPGITIKAEEARVLYNYLLVRMDGTEGVHNPLYALELLDTSLARWDAIPRAAFSFTQTDSCVPVTVDFTDSSMGNLDTYLWEFGDGGYLTTIGSVSHEYLTPGIYTVSLTVAGTGGEDTATGQVAVYDVPVADFTATATQGCNSIGKDSLKVQFTDVTAEGSTIQFWDFGDGSSAPGNDPIHYYHNPDSSYTVTFTATNPCGTDDTTMVIYSFTPVPEFSASDSTVSIGVFVQFNDESVGASKWSWDFGDGNTSELQNPSHAYDSSGVFNVSLTVENMCSDSTTTKNSFITVSP
jgi:PKD repeat protein